MNRIEYIDISKGIGIICVMIAHLSFPLDFLNILYFFELPLFIYLSGLLHKEISVTDSILKFKKILFSILFYAVFFTSISYFSIGWKIPLFSFVKLLTFSNESIVSIPFLITFWFIIALFVVKILSSFTKSSCLFFVLSISLFLLIYYVNIKVCNVVNLPFCIAQALLLSIYYAIGRFRIFIENYMFILSLILFTGISFWTLSTQDTSKLLVDYRNLDLFNPFIAAVLALSGILIIIRISMFFQQRFKISKYIAEIGRLSFFFMINHLFMYVVLLNLVQRFWSLSQLLIVEFVIILILTVVILFFVAKLLEIGLKSKHAIVKGLSKIILLK